MTLHEQITHNLKRQVAEGSCVAQEKEARAEAVLRHRRSEPRLAGSPAWMGALVALFGLAHFLLPPRQRRRARVRASRVIQVVGFGPPLEGIIAMRLQCVMDSSPIE
jgi:hypothetical protein